MFCLASVRWSPALGVLSVMLTHTILFFSVFLFPFSSQLDFLLIGSCNCSDISKVALKEIINRQVDGPPVDLEDLMICAEKVREGEEKTSTAYVHANHMKKAERIKNVMHNSPFGKRQLKVGFTL